MILLFLFFLSLFHWYCSHKRTFALVLLFVYMCDGFGMKSLGDVWINSYNVLFFFSNVVLLYKRAKVISLAKTDKIARFILVFYLIFLFHCLFTVIFRIDGLKYASSVLRQFVTIFLMYFFLMDANKNEIHKALYSMSIIVFILCLIYPLHFWGINIYETGGDLWANENTRLGIPPAIEFFIIYAIITFPQKILIIPYFIPIIVGALRGSISSLAVSFLLYYRKALKNTKIIIIGVISIIIAYFVYSRYFTDSMQRYDVSFTQEVLSSIDKDIILHPENFYGSTHFTFKENGTLSFRIAILAEKFIYIVARPYYLFTGVGMIGEDSPNNHFHFLIGTEMESARDGYAQIETNDILWPSYVLRFGLLGIIFWLLYFRLVYKRCSNCSNNSIATVGMIYCLYLFFHSFGTDMPHRFYSVYLVLLVCVYCYKCKIGNGCINYYNKL